MFCDELGGPICPQGLSAVFKRRRKAARLATGSFHVLRHTAATLALTSGVRLQVVAARPGDRPETILGTYAHLLQQSDAEAAAQVASVIGAAVAG